MKIFFSKPNWTPGQHSNQCLHHALLMGQWRPLVALLAPCPSCSSRSDTFYLDICWIMQTLPPDCRRIGHLTSSDSCQERMSLEKTERTHQIGTREMKLKSVGELSSGPSTFPTALAVTVAVIRISFVAINLLRVFIVIHSILLLCPHGTPSIAFIRVFTVIPSLQNTSSSLQLFGPCGIDGP